LKKYIFFLFIILCQIYSFSISTIVSIAPEKFFLERIAGDKVDIEVLIRPGVDAHSFSPTPNQLIKISKADIYFTIGLEFEKSLIGKIEKINKKIEIVSLDKVCKKRMMEDPFEMHDDNNSHHKHDDYGYDPHVWTSPSNVIKMASLITEVLSQRYPENKEYFYSRDIKFRNELQKTIKEIKEILSIKKENRIFMIFHPSWGYFADEFELNQIPVEIEGKQPTIRELRHILDLAKKKKINTLFVQPQYGSNAPKIIADYIGADLEEIYALEYDYINNLISFAKKIRESFEKDTKDNE